MTDELHHLSIDAYSLVDMLREPLLILSADLRVQKASNAFYRTFRVSPEETVGRLIYDLGNRQWHIPALRTLLEEVLPKNKSFDDFEVEHDFPGVGRKMMLLNARCINRGDDSTELILLAIEDFTERRRSRHFVFSHDLLCVATTQGFFVDVNHAFQRVLGHAREDLLSRPFISFVHPDDVSRTTELMSRLASGRDAEHFRNRFRCKDGSYRWFEWTCPAPVLGERFLYSAARDITDMLAAEEEQRRLNVELTRSNADLEQFAYVASHDLQEPLRAVSGCVQIIQNRYREKLDAGADELINHTVEGARRMQSLINDLLDYSRISRRGGAFAPTDCNVALARALKNLDTGLNACGAVVTHDELPALAADPGQIERLFQNLVGNALKFRGPASPIIHVGAVLDGNTWRFSVRDNGIGIQAEYLERIFVLFQRLHTRTEYPGTGIGLAICKKIVERHGGQISVASVPGAGSTFSFTLPNTESQP